MMCAPASRIASALVLALMACSALGAQQRFGVVRPHVVEVADARRAHPSEAPVLVDERIVRLPGQAWMQLEFSELRFAPGANLEITSNADGAVEILDASARRRRFSAFFNGDSVRLRLWSPGYGGETSYRIASLAGAKASSLVAPMTLCGSDDRVPAGDRRVARLMLRFGNGFSWCSAFLLSPNNDGRALDCLVTSGLCLALPGVVDITAEFRVPSSRNDGSLVHPAPAHQYTASTRRQFSATGKAGTDWGLVATLKNSTTGLYPGIAQLGGFNVTTQTTPAQVDVLSFGASATSLDRSGTLQSSRGSVRPSTTNVLLHRGDTTGGSAGGAVLDDQQNVIALQVEGGCDATATSANAATLMSEASFAAARATFCTQLPDLVVRDLTASTTTWSPRVNVAISSTIANDGLAMASDVDCGYYSSRDATITTQDTLLSSFRIATLAAKSSQRHTTSYRVADTLRGGPCWLGVLADDGEAILEWVESNNSRALALTCREVPNLVAKSIDSTPIVLTARTSVAVDVAIANEGGASVVATTAAIVLSDDSTITRSDRLMSAVAIPALASGLRHAARTSFLAPVDLSSGNCWLGVIADRDSLVAEIDEADNALGVLRSCVGLPDLVAIDVSTPAQLLRPSLRFQVDCDVSNNGSTASPATEVRYVLSNDSFVSSDDVVLGTQSVPAISALSRVSLRTQLSAPSSLANGTCYLGCFVDPNSLVVEQTRVNNTLTTAVRCDSRQARAQLAPTRFALSTTSVFAGSDVRMDATVRNSGVLASLPTRVAFYLSDDRVVSSGDLLLTAPALSALGVNETKSYAETVRMPLTLESGTCWFAVYVDDQNLVPEEDETDNVSLLPANCAARPDLAIPSFTANTSTWRAGTRVRLTTEVQNRGRAATNDVPIAYFLSKDSTISGADTLLVSNNFAPLGASSRRTVQADVALPVSIAPGPCWIGCMIDRFNILVESDETNNTASIAGSCLALPDLTCEVLRIVDARIENGKRVALRTLVRNLGGAASPATVLPVVFSDGAIAQLDDPLFAMISVPALGAGQAHDVTTQVLVPHSRATGVTKLTAFVDPDSQVQEADEQNNVRQLEILVQLSMLGRRSVEWIGRYPDVRRETATLSLASGRGADIALYLPLDGSKPYIMLWSANPTVFSFDALSNFSLGLLNGPAFLGFAGLISPNGRAQAGFRLPQLTGLSLDVYTHCFVLTPSFQLDGFAQDVIKTEIRP